ncbi:hypothetical protein [Microbulbifer guangxiensis]|uniref:hypothetical protein n=1 Tax=Microbulbifer guangxiensis TaxID=2904249 RepID=UPI001F3436E4|nr:hypothetical protein [Microbulbifer guangxiensis]
MKCHSKEQRHGRPAGLLGALLFATSIALSGLPIAAEETTEGEKDTQEPVQVAQVGEKASEGESSGTAGGSASNNNADDYEASEEISEDLSVSFPVDI